MNYPPLHENHLWEIGRDYAAIWEKLPDEVRLEEDLLGGLTFFSPDSGYMECVEEVNPGTMSDQDYDYRLIGRKVRHYDRKRRVFKRPVDWPSTRSTHQELSKVLFEWDRSKQIEYGFQEEA